MFYEKLKEKREQLGLTIEQISDKTKINKKFLEAFEKGDFSVLPRTYARLFLRSYAVELGLDPSWILDEYEKFVAEPGETVQQKKQKETSGHHDQEKTHKKHSQKKADLPTIIIMILMLIFIITVLKQVIKERKQPVASIKTQQIQSHRTSPTTTLPDSGKVERSTPQPQPPVSEKFITLRMITTDTCWIKLTRDNEEPGDTIFLPGAKRIWRAKEKFDIIIGKPAGIRLFLGNKDLGQVGINGIPVRLVITREGIIKKQTFRK
ncbi:MAG: helix-turn-helix domain-containing protein [Candidatus Marinimicrobia bacterium]|nr:helix-turn-helix domain-containing protein [Candidatus Neomarinimicrobiota bacterium]